MCVGIFTQHLRKIRARFPDRFSFTFGLKNGIALADSYKYLKAKNKVDSKLKQTKDTELSDL
ncbi:hypothetical protein EMIT0P74_110100 [Pseudomonas sp. IT-P74]